MEIAKLSPSAYHIHDSGSTLNFGCVVTADGVVVIDTGSSGAMAGRILECIREVTDQPVAYVVNTHPHAEHTLGNHCFDVPIVAHRICSEEMEALRERQRREAGGGSNGSSGTAGRDPVVPPSIRFTEQGYMYMGGRLIELVHAPGHTPGSLVVRLPDEQVMFAGDDVTVDACPVLDGASAFQWIDSLSQMRTWGARRIVPGRGRLAGPDDVTANLEYLQCLVTTAESLRKSGIRGHRVARSEPFLRLCGDTNPAVHEGNIHQVIKRLADR
jgi:glyoxylase-like metal-dependent hydrolase (beta-lactamase superfamily II)